MVERWEWEGQKGKKPKCLKPLEVFEQLGLDLEDNWYGVQGDENELGTGV